jgi:hypothetical protein
MTAEIECHENMIAGGNFRHRLPCALDNTRAFVPKHDRLRHRESLVTHRDVCVTDPGCGEPNEDFIVSWLLKAQCLDRHRRVLCAGDGGLDFHASAPRVFFTSNSQISGRIHCRIAQPQ